MKNTATLFNPKSPVEHSNLWPTTYHIITHKEETPHIQAETKPKQNELINWLYAHNIPHFNEMLKPQFRLIPVQV
jgi:hypothetical protein